MEHIHIIGISGTFMGGIARLALASGYKVTGCDSKIYPPMSTQLEELGIKVIEGFDADQINIKPDVFVIGNIAKRGMPIIEAILNQNRTYTSGPQWLYEHILFPLHVLAVTGTHGKTTTASMLTWILEFADYKPGWLIGGVPENFNVSARLPQQSSKFFVLEADEYDTAFFDKRSKFIHYHPNTLIINNLEYDHADIFENIQAIQKQFHHLIRTIPSHGKIIYKANEPYIKEVLAMGVWTPSVLFASKNKTDFYTKDLGNGSDFEVYLNNKCLGIVNWSLLGKHNQNNALAAIIAAHHIGIDVRKSCEALCQFKNVKRRMEVKGIVHKITIYDDFAHHPTAIQTTIEGLRHKIGHKQRIIVVLEPRSNTMKLGSIKNLLPKALNGADQIFCYASNIDWSFEESLQPIQSKIVIEKNFDEMITRIIQFIQPTDHILVMSNGSFNNIHSILLKKLETVL
ncbi:MAG: UDP-N-acetylmuramate:L-alanyl-gamma-D-glutamyl-meso-diaminopimelate ligase [Neisseriaceae bacterium]|nr:MAG: UDP-N-acetylmuramate:L-alanyl-gamma-D-glutamyl-meso-diaminopimelate ligase [Neisseriaceae bacterium]